MDVSTVITAVSACVLRFGSLQISRGLAARNYLSLDCSYASD